MVGTTLFAHDAPYRVAKFQDVLSHSKLQAPLSSYDPLWSRGYGDFAFYQNRYFYLQDESYMTFEMCQKKHRSELREQHDWKVETKEPKTMEATLLLFPLSSKREFTFLQIHADSNRMTAAKTILNKPLLRVVWKKNYHHLKDHIWAVVRVSADPKEQKYMKIDLGKRPRDFFRVKVVVAQSKMKIYVADKLCFNFDVSYWNGVWNYFKAGVYLQDEGCAKVLFKELKF
jgi:hypothetical protein